MYNIVQFVADSPNRIVLRHRGPQKRLSIEFRHLLNNLPILTNFMLLTEEDASMLIKSSSCKTCLLDSMPSKIVSDCSRLLLVISKILNNCWQMVHFLDDWKEALVFPLLTKVGGDLIFANRRPGSDPQFMSKPT